MSLPVTGKEFICLGPTNRLRKVDLEACPKTRRKLLYFLWYGEHSPKALRSVDVVKVGARWTIEKGGRSLALEVRRLDSWSFGFWRTLICREFNIK